MGSKPTTQIKNKMTDIEKAETAIIQLQEAVNNKDWDGVIAAYEIVEAEDFNWDNVPDYLFDDWDKLTDEGNDIIAGF